MRKTGAVFEDREFNQKLASLVIPIALQQFMLAVVSASDAIMLNLISRDKIVSLDEMIKLPAVYIHYKKYRWVKNLTMKEES